MRVAACTVKQITRVSTPGKRALNIESLRKKGWFAVHLVLLAGLAVPAGAQGSDLIAALPGTQQLQPGQLLTARTSSQNALPDASENILISYISTSFDGKNTVVFGQVSIPRTPVPAGGYPVVSFASGTTGFAPQCAPSLTQGYANGYLNEWLKRGYAVVRTDYEGWGAASPRPIMHGKSNANGIVDIVAAAHSLRDKLSNDWIVLGHSEGGGAALWTAGRPGTTEGKYRLRGAIAVSPTGPGVLKFMNNALNGGYVYQGTQAYISVTVLAAQVVDPSIDLPDLVAKPMMPQVQAAKTACLAELTALPQLHRGEYLKPGTAYDKFIEFLLAQDASSLTMGVPVLIVQGEADNGPVSVDTTEQLIASLCSHNAAIDYRKYRGEGHGSVLGASKDDAFSFAAAVFAGHAPTNSCR